MFFNCLICIQSYIRERTFASLLCAHSNHMRRILIDPQPVMLCDICQARCLRSAGWGESAPAGRPAHALLHWWEILPPFSTRFGEKGPDTSWSVSLICFLSFFVADDNLPRHAGATRGVQDTASHSPAHHGIIGLTWTCTQTAVFLQKPKLPQKQLNS